MSNSYRDTIMLPIAIPVGTNTEKKFLKIPGEYFISLLIHA